VTRTVPRLVHIVQCTMHPKRGRPPTVRARCPARRDTRQLWKFRADDRASTARNVVGEKSIPDVSQSVYWRMTLSSLSRTDPGPVMACAKDRRVRSRVGPPVIRSVKSMPAIVRESSHSGIAGRDIDVGCIQWIPSYECQTVDGLHDLTSPPNWTSSAMGKCSRAHVSSAAKRQP